MYNTFLFFNLIFELGVKMLGVGWWGGSPHSCTPISSTCQIPISSTVINLMETEVLNLIVITLKHLLHVYYSPSKEMQEMVHYFVHDRGGGQDTPARVSSPPPLNIVTGTHTMETEVLNLTVITMKHFLHVYYSPSREMQEIVHYFVHSRGGGQDTQVRVSSPPTLNVVMGFHRF